LLKQLTLLFLNGLMQNNLAPIALFVYNRPEHTKRVLESLIKNPEAILSDLYVFADGQKNPFDSSEIDKIFQVKSLFHNYKNNFKKFFLIERPNNVGLANNIISGITNILRDNESIIVLEDDILVSKGFLNYMNTSLFLYYMNENVATIQGFQFPIKFNQKASTYFDYSVGCWGWATWKTRWGHFKSDGVFLWNKIDELNLWQKFNLNNTYNFKQLLEDQNIGKTDSWAIRWYASMFLLGKLNLYPTKSLVINIGNDGSGIHKDKRDISHFPIIEHLQLSKMDVIIGAREVNKVIEYRRNELRSLRIKNSILKFRINILGIPKKIKTFERTNY